MRRDKESEDLIEISDLIINIQKISKLDYRFFERRKAVRAIYKYPRNNNKWNQFLDEVLYKENEKILY